MIKSMVATRAFLFQARHFWRAFFMPLSVLAAPTNAHRPRSDASPGRLRGAPLRFAQGLAAWLPAWV